MNRPGPAARSIALLALVGLACAAAGAAPVPPAAPGGAPTVRLVEFDTIVAPVTAQRILRSIDAAEENGDALVLIRLDTPGGLVVTMQDVVKRILASDVPVVCWVGPSGAHAASAGFFLLLSADVAAMAPATRTGAASTVSLGENRDDDPLLRKKNEDNAALLRSITERRGRNTELAEKAIFEAKAWQEQEALEGNLIDFVAADVDAVLAALDGREIVRFDGEPLTLRLAGAQIVRTDYGMKHAFMELLGTPIVALFLLLAGVLGLYIEFTQPGVVLPGVVGALCLVLFALSAQILPISAVGVLLILLAVAMFVLEIKIVSYGMLTLGGAICLAVGGWLLIDGPIPAMRVSPWTVLPLSLAVTLVVAVSLHFAIRAQRNRVGTGVEGLVGEIGRVRRALAPEGVVFVHGELWNAVSAGGEIPADRAVRIVRVEEMLLTVEPVAETAAPTVDGADAPN